MESQDCNTRGMLSRIPKNGEVNSGVIVTVPDQSMSISDILQYSIEHSEILEPIPDIPYGLDLTDVYPNQNEFANTDFNFNPIKKDESIESNMESTTMSPLHDGDSKERSGEQNGEKAVE